jgi:hypothetical protein
MPDMGSMADDQMSRCRRIQSRPSHYQLPTARDQLAYLSSTITGQSVVPQGFVRPLDWDLVLMIAMSKCSGNQDGHGQDVGQHGEGGGGG